jgi:hypothetical protein
VDAYKIEDIRLRGLFGRMRNSLYSVSIAQDEAISLSQIFECSQGDAWRLIVLYHIASAKLIDMWLDDKMTWRALWRISTNYPYSNIEQEKAALEPKKQRLMYKKRARELA